MKTTHRYASSRAALSPRHRFSLAGALLLATAGCGDVARMRAERGAADQTRAASMPAEAMLADAGLSIAAPPAAPAQSSVDAMVIRTGSARLEVDSLETAVSQVAALAARTGGSIASSAIQTGERRQREATLTLRVPANRFDEAMGGLAPLGRIEAQHVNAQDVGEEYVDLSARLASARQLEQRLLEILRTRTGDLEDVLAIERELARVRAEIERHEGRIRYLQGRVEMSTLAVALHEPMPVLATPPGETVLGRAVVQAWRNFVGLIAAGIASLGFLVPIGVIAALGVIVLRRGRRAAPAAAASAP